jgi:hypothetical protein
VRKHHIVPSDLVPIKCGALSSQPLAPVSLPKLLKKNHQVQFIQWRMRHVLKSYA